MAYFVVLLSVPESQIRAIQTDSRNRLRPTSQIVVSHALAYSVEGERLNALFREVIDGGKDLSEAYTHPLRPPVYHDARRVQSLYRELDQAWQQAKAQSNDATNKIVGFAEITKVLKFYRSASSRGECIASVLLPPSDVKGYESLKMPFEDPPEQKITPESESSRGRINRPQGSGGHTAGVLMLGGVVTVGVLGLCYWRYRRRTGEHMKKH